MRKEAINTFTEGLVKDLHPLSTPANVLTDALNATLINYDGNEYILQNDVGNGRVETARLPSGYVPVGIKEFGGIIYVASYNPLNGKSQIGSFPSPERQIGTEELGGTYNINSNINTNNAYVRLDIVQEDKKSLYKVNPGDKFMIASSGISQYLNSTYEGILKIHIGVVDRENNIIYIEDDLEYPYIIDSPNITANTNFQVFTSKTSGYLSIIVELLSIDTFDVSRDISLDTLGLGENIEKSNPKFNIVFTGNSTTSSKVKVEQFKFTSNLGNPCYSTTPDLKLGLSELLKTDVLEYTITPICKYGELASFAVSGKIDFSVLGTGYSKLTEWRYYSDRDYLKLNWGMDYDPIKFIKVENVKFTFYDFSNNLLPVPFKGKNPDPLVEEDIVDFYKCSVKDNYNGNFSEKIPYKNDTTNYGLSKNNLYFVKISMDFINQSGKKINPIVYYRMVYTTGIFNKEFIEYKESDFANLSLSYNAEIKIEPNITSKTLTPQMYPNEILGLENPFVGVSSVYNVRGDLNTEIKLDKDSSFGTFNSNIVINDSSVKSGITLNINNKFNNILISDNPSYLGTTTTESETLETKLSEKYDPNNLNDNDRGTVDLESSELKKDTEIYFNIGGTIRRGLYVSATKTINTDFESFTLTKAVANTSDLNEFIASSFDAAGTPNSMKNYDSNHLQISGSIPMVSSDAKMLAANFEERISDSQLPISHGTQVLGKGNLNAVFDNSAVNSMNTSGMKHPIVFMIPDNDGENGKLGRSLTYSYSTKYQGVIHPRRDGTKGWGYIDDYIAVAWKTSKSTYVFINLGGVIAWHNNGGTGTDPIEVDGKWNFHGCKNEFPREINKRNLTILDILYNYLNSIYIPQWDTNTVETIVPDVDKIVYHGNFDDNFKLEGSYDLTVDNSSLFTFMYKGNSVNINPESINNLISTNLNINVVDFKDSIKNNVTTKITNLKNMKDIKFNIEYQIGSSLNLKEWYSKIHNLALNGFIPDRDSVYMKNSTISVDSNNKKLKRDVVYMLKDNKYIPYDGKVKYPDNSYSNTKSNFLKIVRPSDIKQKATLYINPGTLSSKELEVIENNEKNEKLLKLDLTSELYPGCEMFSRTVN